MSWTGTGSRPRRAASYGDVFLQAEQEFSAYNFEHADTEILFRQFQDAEAMSRPAGAGPAAVAAGLRPGMKASHLFNLLDARGVISVTERRLYRPGARGAGALRRGLGRQPWAGCPSAEGDHEHECDFK